MITVRQALLGLAMAGAATLPMGAEAAPNLLVNGSFESFANGAFTGWTNGGTVGTSPSQYATPHPTNGSAPGQFGDVVPADPFTFSPDAAGTQGAYFVADQANQTLSQSVTGLIVGNPYEIGFDLFTTFSGAANPNPFTLTGAFGSLVVTIANAVNTTPGTWTHYGSTFDAPTSSATFTFTFNSGAAPAKDVIADLVYLTTPTSVPEPASLALFGVGLLGLGLIRRHSGTQG